VVLNEREAKRRRFLSNSQIQILPSEGHAGLRDSRLQRAKITDADCSAGLLHHLAVNRQHFVDG
jgi:hypothetical protein